MTLPLNRPLRDDIVTSRRLMMAEVKSINKASWEIKADAGNELISWLIGDTSASGAPSSMQPSPTAAWDGIEPIHNRNEILSLGLWQVS